MLIKSLLYAEIWYVCVGVDTVNATHSKVCLVVCARDIPFLVGCRTVISKTVKIHILIVKLAKKSPLLHCVKCMVAWLCVFLRHIWINFFLTF